LSVLACNAASATKYTAPTTQPAGPDAKKVIPNPIATSAV
jgi:hypothetical protein